MKVEGSAETLGLLETLNIIYTILTRVTFLFLNMFPSPGHRTIFKTFKFLITIKTYVIEMYRGYRDFCILFFRTKSNRLCSTDQLEFDCLRLPNQSQNNRTIGVRLSSIDFWFSLVRFGLVKMVTFL